MFTNYMFRIKVDTNLTEDLNAENTVIGNSEEYLKYVAENLSSIEKFGYNKYRHPNGSHYMITPHMETVGNDFYLCLFIFDTYHQNSEMAEPRDADTWLRESDSGAFAADVESFFNTVLSIYGKAFIYPAAVNWTFEGTKFIDENGKPHTTRIKIDSDDCEGKYFEITSKVTFDDLIP